METDRLVIRKFKKSDVDNLYKLLSDEDNMRYIEPPYSRERTVSFLDAAQFYQANANHRPFSNIKKYRVRLSIHPFS